MTPARSRLPRNVLRLAVAAVVTALALGAILLVGIGGGPPASPSGALVETPSASGTPALPSAQPSPAPTTSSEAPQQAPPPPPEEGTTEPCGTYDPRCSQMPVDGAGVVFTNDLPCGELGTCRLSMGIAQPRAAGGPWPVVVVEPGGPRPPNADNYLGAFAGLVASQGAVVFVADYREGPQWGGGYPQTYQDIACAVRFARENAAQWGGDPSRVTLVAHSLGPFFASVEALSADPFEPAPGTCLATTGSTKPDAFVGIAGVYSTDGVSAEYLDSFFGGSREAAQAAWTAGDPYAVVAAKEGLDIPVRLVHGAIDANVLVSSSEQFGQSLEAAGYDTAITIVPNGDHTGILQDYRTIEAVVGVAMNPRR